MEIQQFYETHAQAFSATRFCLWDAVRDFGNKFSKKDIVLDAGCGNGKNMKYFQKKCTIQGFDKSANLVSICREKGFQVREGDVLSIPFPSEMFNYILCIAVIHHLDSEDKHLQAIHELMRCLRPGGSCFITLWAFESDEYSKKKNFIRGHNLIPFHHKQNMRYYYIYDELMLQNLLTKVQYEWSYTWERGNWNIILKK